MAEKAKAKKAKPLAKKTAAARPKKKEISVKDAYHEADLEELKLDQEELPKRATKSSKTSAKKETAEKAKADTKVEAKVEAKPQIIEDKTKVVAPQPEVIAPIQPRVTPNKPVPQPQQVQGDVRHEKPKHESQRSDLKSPNDGLKIRLSESLVRKLKDQAADEGIALEEFIAELLAESVVLRAWEIVERKNAMKSGNSGHAQQQMSGNRGNYNSNQGHKGGNQRGNNNNNNQGNKGHRGMTHARYQTIMDDKATFLEYVRNQEKSRR